MKILLFLLFLNLIYVSCDEQLQSEMCLKVESPTEKSQCQSIGYDSKLTCCYVTYSIESESFSRCVPIYYNKDSIAQYKSMMHKVKKIKILCSSNYIKFDILLFLLFLMF
jgi:hypothetical protein